MQAHRKRRPSGYVYRRESRRGAKWYAKYRLPNGDRQNRLLGPAWTGRGRPPAGYFTKRTAEDALRDLLAAADRGELAGMVRTGATFKEAGDEWLRHAEQERGCKPSTLSDYRSALNAHLIPAFGSMRVEEITP